MEKQVQKSGGKMKLHTLFAAFMLSVLCLTGCTYSITMVHTEGQATDVVDETATNTPSTSVTPTVSIPAAAL